MKNLTVVFCMLIAFILASCSGVDSNVREYDSVTPLRPGEGYVIFGTLSPNPSLKFEFSNDLNSYVTPAFLSGVDHHMLVLPEGQYRLSSIYAKAAQFLPGRASRYHGWDFKVKAGMINYFGEMVLDGNNINKFYDFKAIQSLVDKEFPGLAGKYEFNEAGL